MIGRWVRFHRKDVVMGYYDDPPEDGCEKCEEAGHDECQCVNYDENDPLDNPAVAFNLREADGGLTPEQDREIEEMVRAEADSLEAYMKELAFIADTYGVKYE
jgi:hypothetical protein